MTIPNNKPTQNLTPTSFTCNINNIGDPFRTLGRDYAIL